jgi:glutathione peroxidase-family protein
LEKLWRDYRDRGLVVLGFPCDQFGHQEPGDEAEILNFCSVNYAVDFPLFAKIDVNGTEAHPLWRWLKSKKSGILGTEAIKWNFTKFLVGRDGSVLKRLRARRYARIDRGRHRGCPCLIAIRSRAGTPVIATELPGRTPEVVEGDFGR